MEKVQFPFDTEEFFQKCVKHNNFPKNDFLKQAVLIHLVKEFEDNKKYKEQEVNEKIKKYFEDYTLLRRELINFGYMQRNSETAEYWVVKRELTKDDIRNNTILRRHAKPYKILEEDN
ncbi:DUF2087 domain-containing protein [Candidatus Woesearchaeota archaeon]|nr:DUF2087 domain-containing protein [Candidatus Woesearchaeota archaeon]MBW3016621.1 DUF2087 domain-containing protein [Candidatus Woesearchaeota archaeon]